MSILIRRQMTPLGGITGNIRHQDFFVLRATFLIRGGLGAS
jgi:hypothetical protein